ncbi:hypothetical protein C8K30_107117 [Promicromonospora sp. AC04]|uniref:cytochrome P450 n=1 Tax=Promicromonospora sp. AC04 TaxID=2135723 RepID=UPI000D3615B3|nr:cytochrome P450 [Promicromonospora sp. AC04]PUB25371.1 hypothetical protein C8K30_107117 [Promicromonospora sp. AC04]
MTTTVNPAENDSAEAPVYPMERASKCPFDPPPVQQAMLDQDSPLAKIRLFDDSTHWLVTRYADQRTLLSDDRLSVDISKPGYPHESVQSKDAAEGGTLSFATIDDPEHARLRRMVTAPFTIKRIEAMRPAVQRITDELIDDLLAGPKPADLVDAFALPLPSLVISELLGVPYDRHEFFQDHSKTFISRTSTDEERMGAVTELATYLGGLIVEKMKDPGDDLLSQIAHERVAAGELSVPEAIQMAVLLLIAGHETTANMIALSTVALLENPDQLQALRETDDPKAVSAAVEELLRYLTIAHNGRRQVALEDIEHDGAIIRAGEGVIMASDSANRDPRVFADPDKLDLSRDARQHMAFGFGVHQCLGQPLARMELQVVFSTLFKRIPTLRLAVASDELPFKYDGIVYGVHKLPVTW